MASKNHDFGQRLGRRLQELGWSGRELARKVGIGKNSVSKYLARGGVPEWDILVKISETVGVTTDWLLTGREPLPKGPCGLGADKDPILRLLAQEPELEKICCDYAEARLAGVLPEEEVKQLEFDLRARAYYLVQKARATEEEKLPALG